VEVETMVMFTVGVVLIPIGSFLWSSSLLSDEVKHWAQFMYWIGFALLVNALCHVVKHLKLVLAEFAVLGVVLGFLGLIWSDTLQGNAFNPLTLAAFGIILGTIFMVIEVWEKERQAGD